MALEHLARYGIDAHGARQPKPHLVDEGLVDADVDQHVRQVGDAHQRLAVLHRLALGDDRLGRRRPPLRVCLGDVVDDDALVRGVNLALLDLLEEILVERLLLDEDGLGRFHSRRRPSAHRPWLA